MKNVTILLKFFAALVALCLAVCLASCNEGGTDSETTDTATDTEDTEARELDYSDVDVYEYVKDVTYKGLSITLDKEDDDKQTLLWKEILNSSWISSYPEDKIEYYFLQTKEFYMHTVGYNEEDYLLLLKNRGTNEEEMREEARNMVAKDLLYRYIVDVEGIVITEEEKQELFDRYVGIYVAEYGYNEDYVLANMTDYIYESMLYDKTMELLLTSNTFTVAAESETK